MKRKILACLLAAALMAVPALAAEESAPQPQTVAPWAQDGLGECTALGMWDDSYLDCIQDPVTDEQMELITAVTAEKLALLALPAGTGEAQALVVDHTRGGVIAALYQELAAYELEGITPDPVETLTALGVVQGDGIDVAAGRTCTLQEALIMAQRLILNVYDRCGAGTHGLLWKAQGNGNTLYLMGTFHVDRGNMYPMHRQVRQALLDSELLALEVDFTDEEDMARYQVLQCYDDGTTLADHVSPELYERTSAVFLTLGLTQEQIDGFRAWALAATLNQLAMIDDSTGDTLLPPDLYLQNKALYNNIPLTAVESATFQAEHVFNDLSDEYLEAYLESGLLAYEAAGQTTPGEDYDDLMDQTDAMLTAWQSGDPEAFALTYDKDTALDAAEDEMVAKLFLERDPNMIAWADTFLKQEGAHTGMMAVGAGHMIGRTGIVQGLTDLGYTVELVAP